MEDYVGQKTMWKRLWIYKNETVIKESEEKRFQKEIERLRREGSKLLEEEMERINKELRIDNNKTVNQFQNTSRLKITWPKSKINDESNKVKLNSDLLTHLFTEKYGKIDVLVMGKKSNSAIVEFKHYKDAQQCFNEKQFLYDTYSINLEWLRKTEEKQFDIMEISCPNKKDNLTKHLPNF